MKTAPLFFIVLFLLIGPTTWAQSFEESSYILEPYLGYEKGFLTQKGIPEIDIQGPNFGARLGYTYSSIGFGLDFMMGTGTANQDGESGAFKPTDIGVFVGHKFEMGFNIYASYFFSSKAKIQPDIYEKDFSGSGYKFGLGYRVYSYLEVSLELVSRKYMKYESDTMNNPLQGSSAGISIGVPLL